MTGGGGFVALFSVMVYILAYGETSASQKPDYSWFHWKTILRPILLVIVKLVCR